MRKKNGSKARVNQQLAVGHEGWMRSGPYYTLFHWVPVP